MQDKGCLTFSLLGGGKITAKATANDKKTSLYTSVTYRNSGKGDAKQGLLYFFLFGRGCHNGKRNSN
jgi:hypothetical protein